MRLLTDTHICIWSFQAPERLSPSAASLLKDPANEIFLSMASIWEIQIKINRRLSLLKDNRITSAF